jgi:hypothetical protein
MNNQSAIKQQHHHNFIANQHAASTCVAPTSIARFANVSSASVSILPGTKHECASPDCNAMSSKSPQAIEPSSSLSECLEACRSACKNVAIVSGTQMPREKLQTTHVPSTGTLHTGWQKTMRLGPCLLLTMFLFAIALQEFHTVFNEVYTQQHHSVMSGYGMYDANHHAHFGHYHVDNSNGYFVDTGASSDGCRRRRNQVGLVDGELQ